MKLTDLFDALDPDTVSAPEDTAMVEAKHYVLPAEAIIDSANTAPIEAPTTEEKAMSNTITKTNGDTIKVEVKEFKGKTYLDIRTYFEGYDGDLRPTKKGVTIPMSALRTFRGIVNDLAEAVA